jgi:hypothetical protein
MLFSNRRKGIHERLPLYARRCCLNPRYPFHPFEAAHRRFAIAPVERMDITFRSMRITDAVFS